MIDECRKLALLAVFLFFVMFAASGDEMCHLMGDDEMIDNEVTII